MTKSHAEVLLSEQLAAEVQMRDSLKDALARTRRLGEGLCQKLRELKKEATLLSNHNTLLEEDGGNSIMHRLAFHVGYSSIHAPSPKYSNGGLDRRNLHRNSSSLSLGTSLRHLMTWSRE